MTEHRYLIDKTFDEVLAENEDLHDCAEVFGGYEDFGFESDVNMVFEALLTESAVGTIVLSWECGTDGVINGANFLVAVESPEKSTWGWLGVWHEIKHLTNDRDAKGIEGYRAIWDALSDYVTDAMALCNASGLKVRW